ncbi:MAG: glucose-6-phosphate isomerase, partial [Spirochaetales bacterium]|nr:glucose-6-phosphate isomerase [Spirochaetales bacterium]
MINWNNLDTLSAYKKLLSLKGQVRLGEVLSAARVSSCQVPVAAGLTYNYASKQVNDQILTVLQELADEQELIAKYKALLSGETINTGEGRKVLHHLARGQLVGDVVFEGKNLRSFYREQQDKIAAFVSRVHNGEITGTGGERFTTVVQIGIGGSDLGPRAMYLSLNEWAVRSGVKKMDAKFISNVDPDDGAAVIGSCDLGRTLFILVSKSGTTQETLANYQLVKSWALGKGIKNFKLEKQMLAVTSKESPLASSSDFLTSFYIDDYIGGRYSSTSAVGGVIISLAYGFDIFDELLAGAAESDQAALGERVRENAALLDACIGVYYR